MNSQELLAELNDLTALYKDDPEAAHMVAESLVLDYIDNDAVSRAFRELHHS